MKPSAKPNPREQPGIYKKPIWAESWWKETNKLPSCLTEMSAFRISSTHDKASQLCKLWSRAILFTIYGWVECTEADPTQLCCALAVRQGSRCDVWSRTFLQVITVIEVLLPRCVPCLLNGGSGCVIICFAVGGLTELLPLDELGIITTRKTSQPEPAAKPAVVSLCIFALPISISPRSHLHKGLQVSQDN